MGNYTFENLNSTNLKHYSQAYSNDHIYKMTTYLRQLMLSPPKQIPTQLFLY